MINNYYIMVDREQSGPFSYTELLEQGLSPDTLIQSPLSNDWEYAGVIPEFYQYFESADVYYPATDNMAGFWWRLLAYVIDYIIFLSLMFAVGIFLGIFMRYTGTRIVLFDRHGSNLGFKLSAVSGLMLYNAIFESLRPQGSIGKIICKLKVVDAYGFRITFFNALGRNWGKFCRVYCADWDILISSGTYANKPGTTS